VVVRRRSQHILGVRPDFNGLIIDPCIPKKWKGFTVQRKFRGVTYTIEVKNPKAKSKGVKSLLVDGKKIVGNLIPLPAPGTTAVKIEVTLAPDPRETGRRDRRLGWPRLGNWILI